MIGKAKTPIKYIWLFAALAVIIGYVQFDMTVWSYNCDYHGIKSLDDIIAGNAPAPTQYRLLVPLIFKSLEFFIPVVNDWRIVWIYEPMKMLFIFLALWAGFKYMRLFFKEEKSLLLVCVMFLFMTLSFFTDYPEQFSGLAIFSLAFIGIYQNNQKQVSLWTFIGVLNKETAFVIPLFNMMVNRRKGRGWMIPMAVFGVTASLLRWFFGFKEYYTHFWMFWINVKEIGLFPIRYLGLYNAKSLFYTTEGDPIWMNKVQVLAPYWNPVWFVVLGFGVFLYYVLKKLNTLPAYIKQGLLTMAIFFGISFCISLVREIRIFSWFYLILIPAFFKESMNGEL